jgi:uncharacterized C2H2 Zn-finger protein
MDLGHLGQLKNIYIYIYILDGHYLVYHNGLYKFLKEVKTYILQVNKMFGFLSNIGFNFIIRLVKRNSKLN